MFDGRFLARRIFRAKQNRLGYTASVRGSLR